jgi:RHS repeat-associated protein
VIAASTETAQPSPAILAPPPNARPLPGTHVYLLENSRLGLAPFVTAQQPAFPSANQNNALGIPVTVRQTRVGSRCSGKERDVETGLDYFGARYLSSAQGRWTSPDWSPAPEPVPYAKLDDPQTLNLYSYVRNNPLATADADGHTDYYTTGGKKLGSDGVDNGAVVVTKTENPQRMEDGTIIAPSAYEGAVCGFSRAEGEAIQSSVDRTLARAGGDLQGGFHEEGFTEDAGGIHVAAPGPIFMPGDSEAHITQSINSGTTMIEHTHPSGTQDSAGSTTFGGSHFDPKPSTGPGQDVPNARGQDNITHVEASAGNKTVYIYNGNGVQAQVPLSAFPRPKKDPQQ